MDALDRQIAARHQHGHRGRRQQQHVEEQGKGIHRDEPARRGRVQADGRHERRAGHGKGRQGDAGEHLVGPGWAIRVATERASQDEIEQQDGNRSDGQRDFGQQVEEVGRREARRHQRPAPSGGLGGVDGSSHGAMAVKPAGALGAAAVLEPQPGTLANAGA